MDGEKVDKNQETSILEKVKTIAGIYIELEDERLNTIVSGVIEELEGMGIQIRIPDSADYNHYCRVVHDMSMPIFYNNHNQSQKFQKDLKKDINTLKTKDYLASLEEEL